MTTDSVWSRLAEASNPAHYRPCRHPQLVSSRLQTRLGEDYVIVQNPQASTYRRLRTDEFELLELMDGTRSVRDLVVAYMLRHHRFALPLILRLVRDLKVARMLTDEPRYIYGALRGRLRGRLRRRGASTIGESVLRSFLRREFPLGDIDGLLTRAYRGGVWLLFTRQALVLMLLVTVVGLPLLAVALLRSDVADQSLAVTLPLFYGCVLLIAVVHELAHAFTVKSYGRLVRRGGVAIFYGSPGMFMDTQDIWMEPRRARIAVSVAGPFSGLVLAGLAGLVLAAAPDASWAPTLVVFAAAAVMLNLVQLVPLIQLDGYYLLMDWLDMPNLRPRAFGFVRHELAGKLRRREPFDRTERILVAFGVLAAAYTGYVVVVAAGFAWLRASEVLTDALAVPSFGRLAGAAIVLALLVPVVLVLVQRLRRGARSLLSAARALRRLAAERRYRERVAALAQVPALARLGKGRVQSLARLLTERTYPTGAVLPPGGFVLVLDGTATTGHSSLGAGDYVLAPRAPVRAGEPLRVLELPADQLPAEVVTRSTDDDRAALDGVALLEGLGPREKDTLLAHLLPRSYDDGETIVAVGAPGREFFLVRRGTVLLRDTDGAVVRGLHAGDYFGEAALLDDTPHATAAVAVGPTALWALPRAAFDEILCRYFDLTAELARTSARRQAHDALRGTVTGQWLDVDVGQQAPDFTLQPVTGPPVTLSEHRDTTVLLWFSRGMNCPYCWEYMARLDADIATFRAAGVQILQVAPNSVEGAREFWRGRELSFPFLCDPEKTAYRLCGLHDIGAGEAQRNNLRGFAHSVAVGGGGTTLRAVWLDLRHATTGAGERLAHHGLAAVEQGMFLIDRDGVIRRKYVFGPLAEPPTNAELLAAVAELQEEVAR